MKTTEIMKALDKIGAPKSNLGYKYIMDALNILSEDTDYFGKITGVYHEIGSRNNSSASRVERAIRHEIDIIYKCGNPENLNEVLGTYRKNGKLPNKEFIISLYYYVYYQEGNNNGDEENT